MGTNLSTAVVGRFSSTQRRSSSAWEETGGVGGGLPPTGRILTVSEEMKEEEETAPWKVIEELITDIHRDFSYSGEVAASPQAVCMQVYKLLNFWIQRLCWQCHVST